MPRTHECHALGLDGVRRTVLSWAQMRMNLNTEAPPALSTAEQAAAPAKNRRLARWVARFGVAGFLFFLIKGLAWLIVPAAIAAYAARS